MFDVQEPDAPRVPPGVIETNARSGVKDHVAAKPSSVVVMTGAPIAGRVPRIRAVRRAKSGESGTRSSRAGQVLASCSLGVIARRIGGECDAGLRKITAI